MLALIPVSGQKLDQALFDRIRLLKTRKKEIVTGQEFVQTLLGE